MVQRQHRDSRGVFDCEMQNLKTVSRQLLGDELGEWFRLPAQEWRIGDKPEESVRVGEKLHSMYGLKSSNGSSNSGPMVIIPLALPALAVGLGLAGWGFAGGASTN